MSTHLTGAMPPRAATPAHANRPKLALPTRAQRSATAEATAKALDAVRRTVADLEARLALSVQRLRAQGSDPSFSGDVVAIREELANQRAALLALAPVGQPSAALSPVQQHMSAGALALGGTTAFGVVMSN